VKCYAVAAQRTVKTSSPGERLIGDGLVTVDSALGRHKDASKSLNIPKSRTWVGYQMGHFDLLNHADVYTQIRNWLQEPA